MASSATSELGTSPVSVTTPPFTPTLMFAAFVVWSEYSPALMLFASVSSVAVLVHPPSKAKHAAAARIAVGNRIIVLLQNVAAGEHSHSPATPDYRDRLRAAV